jgi:hypothetical protein
VNRDGVVDSRDVELLKDYLAKKCSLSAAALKNANVTKSKDGPTIRDATEIERYIKRIQGGCGLTGQTWLEDFWVE